MGVRKDQNWGGMRGASHRHGEETPAEVFCAFGWAWTSVWSAEGPRHFPGWGNLPPHEILKAMDPLDSGLKLPNYNPQRALCVNWFISGGCYSSGKLTSTKNTLTSILILFVFWLKYKCIFSPFPFLSPTQLFHTTFSQIHGLFFFDSW